MGSGGFYRKAEALLCLSVKLSLMKTDLASFENTIKKIILISKSNPCSSVQNRGVVHDWLS